MTGKDQSANGFIAMGIENKYDPKAFHGQHIDAPEYANFGDYANPKASKTDKDNPTAGFKDSMADRQMTKLADAYVKEHHMSNASYATGKDMDKMDASVGNTVAKNVNGLPGGGRGDQTEAQLKSNAIVDIQHSADRKQIGDVDPKGFAKTKEYAQAYMKEQQTGKQVLVDGAKLAPQSAQTTQQVQADQRVMNLVDPKNKIDWQGALSKSQMNPQSISKTNTKTDYGVEQQAAQPNQKGAILDQFLSGAVQGTGSATSNDSQASGPQL